MHSTQAGLKNSHGYSDCVVWFLCVTAVEKKLVSEDSGRLDSPFVKGGRFTGTKPPKTYLLTGAVVQMYSIPTRTPIQRRQHTGRCALWGNAWGVYNRPKEQEWLLRRDNWMSDTIQNKIIKRFAHTIQREIVSPIVSPFMDWQLIAQLTWVLWNSSHATYSTLTTTWRPIVSFGDFTMPPVLLQKCCSFVWGTFFCVWTFI